MIPVTHAMNQHKPLTDPTDERYSSRFARCAARYRDTMAFTPLGVSPAARV